MLKSLPCKIWIVFLLCFFLTIFYNKKANSQVVDSMYYGWVVYEVDENSDNKKCYIATTPKKTDTSYTRVRIPYIAITRYAKNRVEEISVYSGYEYKISSDVYLLIDGVQKKLFTKNDMAWALLKSTDKDIIQTMLKSEYVRVRSDSSTGDYSVDDYSMKGLTRAYARMKMLCE